MKEPLQGKTQSHCHRKDMTDRHDIHDDTDIKSAVEWLKGEIRILPTELSRKQFEIQLAHIIPKAFADVVDHSKNEGKQ